MPADVTHEDEAASTAPGAADGTAADAPLPWYRSALNLAVVALAIAVLAGGIGYVIGNNRAIPDPNRTDIGFLQDMRYHHEQAVQMGLLYINTVGSDPDLRTIAREIVIGQDIEIGRMIQLLRDYGEAEINETDVAMAWMGEPTPLDQMPGLATEADLDQLRHATGVDADRVFVQLMVAHHQGGIHMAEVAERDAATAEVRDMARSIAESQQSEIGELQTLLAAAIAAG